MPTCEDCKHYNPVDEKTGNCFGVEVKADMNADDCQQRPLNLNSRIVS